MSSSSSQPGGYLVDWRNSFSLVRKNTYCKNGQTFRGKKLSCRDAFCVRPVLS